MEVKKITEGMTAPQVAQVIDDNFKGIIEETDTRLYELGSKVFTSFYNNVSYKDGFLVSDYIEVSKGSVIKVAVDKSLYPDNVVDEYNSSFNRIDRWTVPSGVREITIEKDNTAFIKVKFSTNVYTEQYVEVDGAVKASVDVKKGLVTKDDLTPYAKKEEAKIKSNIGFLSCENNTGIVIDGNNITFNNFGWDIYSEGLFFRSSDILSEPETISLYEGSGFIGFDVKTRKFFSGSSEGEINSNVLIVGYNRAQNVVLFATIYTDNGILKGLYHNNAVLKEFDKNNGNSPISSKILSTLFYKDAICVCRGSVKLEGSTVTIGKGDYYLYNKVGLFSNVYLTEAITITLGTSEKNCLVYNISSKEFSTKNITELVPTDIICLLNDEVRGIVGGLWYEYLFFTDHTAHLNKLDILERKYLNGLSVKSDNIIYTEFFDVSVGDIVKWTSFLATTAISLQEYDAAGTFLDHWTAPSATRTITITNEKTKRVRAIFSFREETRDQTLYINNTLKASFVPLKNPFYGSAYFCRAGVSVNTSTREVTINAGDIYTPVKGYSFYRFSEPYTFTLDDGGTNFILYDYKLHTLSTGEALTADTCVIGVKKEYEVFFNGDVKVTYSNGEVVRNYISESQIKNIVGEVEDNNIPSFVKNESLSTYNRVMAYLGSQNGYLLAQITDVHSGGSVKYKHVGYLNSLNNIWGFNVLCNSGDIGLDVGETDDAAITLMYNTKAQMNCTSPWLFCKGNHERLISMKKLGNIFMKPSKRQFTKIQFGEENGLYGYIDDDDAKVRSIYLNTSDTDSKEHYSISDEQINWLGNTLFSTENGYRIVILTHLCPKQIGEWTDHPNDWKTASNLVKIIEGFAQRLSVSHSDKTWDYSNKAAKIVCVLSGDSHFNNFTKENGVNYIVRQGYGGISESSKPEGATSDAFSYTSQCLFDVLVIKNDSNAKVFRIGAGGETRDLEITF